MKLISELSKENSKYPFAILKAPKALDSCWPTSSQEHILRVALSDPGMAKHEWLEWNAQHSLEHDQIDIGSYRLLPLVYKNLLRSDITAPYLNILEGLYKRTWLENQIKLHAYSEVLRALEGAGINTLVLKGISIAIHYYSDLGARPMLDIDILIPKHSVFAAIKILSDCGWLATGDLNLNADMLDGRHACGFKNSTGLQLDLHWHVLHFCLNDHITNEFWDAAIPLKLNGLTTRALCPADQLLHICTHGLMSNTVPPIRWIADSYLLIKTNEMQVDWNRLANLTVRSNESLRMYSALFYLVQNFQLPISKEIINKLGSLKPTLAQKTLFSILMAKSNFGVWESAFLFYYRFLLNGRFKKTQINPFAFIAYLQMVKGFKNSWQVYKWAFTKTAIRIRKLFQ